MYEYHNNILSIPAKLLYEDWSLISYKNYNVLCHRGKLPGGNGTTFDWKVLANYPSTKPFFLSGGIGSDELEDVNELLKTSLPIHAIDVNSKFEMEAGLKNIQLCRDAINRVSTQNKK